MSIWKFEFLIVNKKIDKEKTFDAVESTKIMYDINDNCFVFNDDENFQTLFKFQHSINLSYVSLYMMTNFDFNWWRFFLIMRVNLFTKIDDKNFNEIFLSTIKKNFKKVAEFISRNKDDVNSNAHELLFYKQKNRVRLDIKIQNRWCSKFIEISRN